MSIRAVIFDLDGVILSTDDLHYLAWKKMSDKENIYFDREINERLRGVSRMESLNVILERAPKNYTLHEKKELTEYKNNIYRASLNELTPDYIFPGVLSFINFLKGRSIKIAIASSSKNTKFILSKIGLDKVFGVVTDGTNIKKSKPDPEVFLKTAEKISVEPADCLVIEDADAGLKAAKAAGMLTLGVGLGVGQALTDYFAKDMISIDRSVFEN